MKQIKTIRNRLDNAEDFDREVNVALRLGWELKYRTVIYRTVIVPMAHADGCVSYNMLYAELEREE